MTRERYSPLFVVLILVVSSVLLAGCGNNGDGTATSGTSSGGQVIDAGGAADGLTVMFDSEPDPPAEGDNTFVVTVTRSDGSPVTDATVTTVFSMPAMPSMNMPAMRSEAALDHEAEGRYRGTGQLEMGGAWNVAVTVARGSEELGSRRFSIVAKE